MTRVTEFSPCRNYRYTLWREWTDDVLELEERENNNSAKFVQFIGLNPSTADETKDDPTIRRCIGYAKAWGYGALCMTNLFAFRATDPRVMKRQGAPIGLDNTPTIVRVAKEAGIIICAWGVHGKHRNRASDVVKALRSYGIKLHCLATTADGNPSHPLYLRAELMPVEFNPTI